jgi:hypothetical protein
MDTEPRDLTLPDASCRRCIHCSQAVRPNFRRQRLASNVAAWLAGFCSALCQRNRALSVVADGGAWWQKGGAR